MDRARKDISRTGGKTADDGNEEEGSDGRKKRRIKEEDEAEDDGSTPGRKKKAGYTSKYRGVMVQGSYITAMVYVPKRQQSIYLGTFPSELEAALKYDEVAKKMIDNPLLNFLPNGELNPDRRRRIDSVR